MITLGLKFRRSRIEKRKNFLTPAQNLEFILIFKSNLNQKVSSINSIYVWNFQFFFSSWNFLCLFFTAIVQSSKFQSKNWFSVTSAFVKLFLSIIISTSYFFLFVSPFRGNNSWSVNQLILPNLWQTNSKCC